MILPPSSPSPTPVLLLARELGAGGSERQLAEVARALDRERFIPYVGSFLEGVRAPELRAAGIELLPIPVRSLMRPHALAGAWRLRRYLRERRIQVVHAFDYPLACFAVPIARAAGVPVVLSSQRGHRSLTPPAYRTLLRMTDKLVDGVVVNCQAMRRHLTDEEGVPERLIHVCYNGLDTTRFHPLPRVPRPAGLEDAELVIGTLCVLRPEKNVALLLDAFAGLARSQPRLKLAIVGSGPERDGLMRRAAELGLTQQCLFVPAAADTAAWLNAMDIFVLPSLTEGFSNALMEAMACGCAVAASRVGGTPELVTGGVNGLLFESGDAAGLIAKLTELTANPELRRRLAASAAATVAERFSIQASAACLGDLYRRLLDKAAIRKPG